MRGLPGATNAGPDCGQGASGIENSLRTRMLSLPSVFLKEHVRADLKPVQTPIRKDSDWYPKSKHTNQVTGTPASRPWQA